MTQTVRPLSPHLQVYRWQIQMVTSIVHRATGIALAAGSLLVVGALLALAAGPEAWSRVTTHAGAWYGLAFLFAWTWALAYHLLNGLRHLLQDVGWGYAIAQFVRNGWLVVIGSLVLTAITWGLLAARGVLA
ncbi:succinate dehydrogenase, cytochrome b556 subunit [Dokdonella sp.]|uniref:succinate dehydrogenase, cytochrome b556 subunit n=1 Tax=Dokdonella sp. TaxID=2291710 RepID=UPI0025BB781D|nr:succinate dehydrogenase, cytochrome b556 subunit [Dokdonella sp.]MBX3692602.1 succinate dehydrogenase, cytochrome b556 subunit [Dokdonella sp.]MCW5569224.1 succinate dehydrogenase, cytochrome b556 subunit [Dokdonella sp.]